MPGTGVDKQWTLEDNRLPGRLLLVTTFACSARLPDFGTCAMTSIDASTVPLYATYTVTFYDKNGAQLGQSSAKAGLFGLSGDAWHIGIECKPHGGVLCKRACACNIR